MLGSAEFTKSSTMSAMCLFESSSEEPETAVTPFTDGGLEPPLCELSLVLETCREEKREKKRKKKREKASWLAGNTNAARHANTEHLHVCTKGSKTTYDLGFGDGGSFNRCIGIDLSSHHTMRLARDMCLKRGDRMQDGFPSHQTTEQGGGGGEEGGGRLPGNASSPDMLEAVTQRFSPSIHDFWKRKKRIVAFNASGWVFMKWKSSTLCRLVRKEVRRRSMGGSSWVLFFVKKQGWGTNERRTGDQARSWRRAGLGVGFPYLGLGQVSLCGEEEKKGQVGALQIDAVACLFAVVVLCGAEELEVGSSVTRIARSVGCKCLMQHWGGCEQMRSVVMLRRRRK